LIVKTEQIANSMLPVNCTQKPDAFARLPVEGGFAFLIFPPLVKEEEMKLYMFFALIDLLILLAYPFVFIASKVRKYFGFKR
jgi:hypothetical protein